jgi:hypothetical protein
VADDELYHDSAVVGLATVPFILMAVQLQIEWSTIPLDLLVVSISLDLRTTYPDLEIVAAYRLTQLVD